MHRTLWLEDLRQDLRICARSLLRAKLLTLTIIGTVGLGIGAATVIFSAINAALLRPLPYADPGRLVRIYTDAPPNRFRFSVADFSRCRSSRHISRPWPATPNGPWRSAMAALPNACLAAPYRGATSRFSAPAPRSDGTSPTGRQARRAARRHRQQRILAAASRRAGRRDRQPHAIRRHRLHAGRRASGCRRAARQARISSSPRSGTTPPRKGPFFITVLASCDRPAARRRRPRSCGRSTAHLPVLAVVVSGREGVVGPDGLSRRTSSATLRRSRPGAGGGRARLADRVRQRVQPAGGAGGQSPARAGCSRRAGCVARPGHSLPAGGERVAGRGRGRRRRALASLGVGFLRAFGSGYFPRTQEIALDGPVLWMLAGADDRERLLFGLVPALHGTGGTVDDALRAAGRSSTGNLAVRRIRRVLVAGQFAIATPLLIVSGSCSLASASSDASIWASMAATC